MLYLLLFLIMHFSIQCSELTLLANLYGTDKGPIRHNYTEIYEKYLSMHKNQPIKFLEIGFHLGASARMWDHYFTNPIAKLFFIDVQQWCYQHMHDLSNRSSLHMVDQSNQAQLLEFVRQSGGNFDIIIDDGGHLMEQQKISFQTLFPYVKKGGVYIIEDLHTSYWIEWGGGGNRANPTASAHSTIRFLQFLIDDLNYIGARTESADKNKCSEALKATLNIYQKDIASMHFYDSLCFIFKN